MCFFIYIYIYTYIKKYMPHKNRSIHSGKCCLVMHRHGTLCASQKYSSAFPFRAEVTKYAIRRKETKLTTSG